MLNRFVMVAAVALASASAAIAQTHEHRVDDPLTQLSAEAQKLFDGEDGHLSNSARAGDLIRTTIGGRYGVDLPDEDWYCIIHVVRWSPARQANLTALTISQAITNQHWYVFRGGKHPLSGEEFAAGRRIWGSKRVWLLYVHLGLSTRVNGQVKPSYLVALTKKDPANIQALKELIGLFPKVAGNLEAPTTGNYFGAGPIETKGWVTSDISVSPIFKMPKRIVHPETREIVGSVDPPETVDLKLGTAAIFDNEGRHRWDAGIGVPVRRASDLKLDTATGIATPARIDKTSILALISVYPYPVDLKSASSQAIPHLLFGTDVSEKPSNELFIGVGWGPVFANFYVGGSYKKLDAPNAKGRDREWQATGGVFLKARGIADKLK